MVNNNLKKRFKLNYLEFYISHSCNFNCIGCNRFNNYLFSGHELWDSYKHVYKKWSERLDLESYNILGGEPMSNPDLIKWIYGLRELWPNADAKIETNGSYTKKFTKIFYDTLKNTNTQLGIGLHNRHREKEVLDLLQSFLHKPKIIYKTDTAKFENSFLSGYNNIKADHWPDCKNSKDWYDLPKDIQLECKNNFNFFPEKIKHDFTIVKFHDQNNVTAIISPEYFFHQGALIKTQKNSFTLHNSDPDKAHSICHSKKCHHMMHGKISKCGQVVLFKEFQKQFNIELDDKDNKLLHSYVPADVNFLDDQLNTFIENLNQPLAQCKFCPENYKPQEIFSTSSKDKFGKQKTNE